MRKPLFSVVVLLAVVGCSQSPDISPPKPTDTASPTHTSTLTPTTAPTSTIAPFHTPSLTITASPTHTPVPLTDTPQAEATPDSIFLAEGVWRCPDSTTGATYVGSEKSNKFHHLNCEWARKIKAENRICFADRAAALSYGYIPCGVCKP